MVTVSMSDSAHKAIKGWCKKMDLTFAQFFDRFVLKVELRQQAKFYDSLPKVDRYVKPLEKVRIKKKNKN